MDEQKSINRMKRGDITGLSTLVERYQTRAVRTAMLITRDTALAEDVVQNAFINAYKKIHQFDTTRPFEPWFLRSVTRAAVKAAKKQHRTLSLDAETINDMPFHELLTAYDVDPHSALEQSEQREQIRKALDDLSPEQRAAVVMRYYLEMSENDMADALNTPKGTIKWRLHQARKRLKGLLKRYASLQTEGQ